MRKKFKCASCKKIYFLTYLVIFLMVNFSISSIKAHEEKQRKSTTSKDVAEGAIPAYLLDREKETRGKVLSNMIKQKRKEKAVRYFFPLIII